MKLVKPSVRLLLVKLKVVEMAKSEPGDSVESLSKVQTSLKLHKS